MSGLTVNKLLDDDKLNDLAGKIVDGKHDNVIVIYRDKEKNKLCWDTNITSWVELFGTFEIAYKLLDDEWRGQA